MLLVKIAVICLFLSHTSSTDPIYLNLRFEISSYTIFVMIGCSIIFETKKEIMTSGDLGFDIKSWDINQDTPRYMRQLIPKHKLNPPMCLGGDSEYTHTKGLRVLII